MKRGEALDAAAATGVQGIVVPVPEADPLVDDIRRAGDWSRGAGMPAHITIAGPWPSVASLPTGQLESVARESLRTTFSLDRIDVLGDAVCLLPVDQGPLQRWRDAILEVLDRPDGAEQPWHCHLTVCRGSCAGQLAALKERLCPSLPLRCEVREVRMLDFPAAGRLSMSALAAR